MASALGSNLRGLYTVTSRRQIVQRPLPIGILYWAIRPCRTNRWAPFFVHYWLGLILSFITTSFLSCLHSNGLVQILYRSRLSTKFVQDRLLHIQDAAFKILPMPFSSIPGVYKECSAWKNHLVKFTKAAFGYDNSVSLQTDDAGHVGAAVLGHVACVVGLQTNDVRGNWKGL